MSPAPTIDRPQARRLAEPIFTIVGGTTIPERAEIVRLHCREGSTVELRRQAEPSDASSPMEVWLQCPSLFGLVTVWKKIGHVPLETARELEPHRDDSANRVVRGIVRSVYAPVGRSEAAVTVEIDPATTPE